MRCYVKWLDKLPESLLTTKVYACSDEACTHEADDGGMESTVTGAFKPVDLVEILGARFARE